MFFLFADFLLLFSTAFACRVIFSFGGVFLFCGLFRLLFAASCAVLICWGWWAGILGVGLFLCNFMLLMHHIFFVASAVILCTSMIIWRRLFPNILIFNSAVTFNGMNAIQANFSFHESSSRNHHIPSTSSAERFSSYILLLISCFALFLIFFVWIHLYRCSNVSASAHPNGHRSLPYKRFLLAV